MKRILAIALPLLMILCSCTPAPNAEETKQPWTVKVLDSTERVPTDLDELASYYTNVMADVWQWENELWQLSVIKSNLFVTAIYVADKSVVIQADTVEDVALGLAEYGMADAFNVLLNVEPYRYLAISEVENVVDGWGTKSVGPYILPWPENATSTDTAWQSDNTTFTVVEGGELEQAGTTLDEMIEFLIEDEIEDVKLWYVEGEDWQGMAWHLMNQYYISVAWYDDWGACTLMSVVSDITEFDAVAEHYGVTGHVEELFNSEPQYQN